jgi:hypothetical protein
MSFNPVSKTGKLADIDLKTVNKKAIDKLSKKYTSSAKMAPFFINAAHKDASGAEAPLFIFGKLNKFKAEIKALKGPEQLSGLCFVKLDDKGVPTLCLAPVRGKLHTKTTLLTKAMKSAFTNAYANFEILAEITEEAAAAAEAAAETEVDEAEGEEVASAAADAPQTTEAAPAADAKVANLENKTKELESLVEELKSAADKAAFDVINGKITNLFKELTGAGKA